MCKHGGERRDVNGVEWGRTRSRADGAPLRVAMLCVLLVKVNKWAGW